ncbi:HYR-like domain-containing protein, partial [Algoriphagus chordae]
MKKLYVFLFAIILFTCHRSYLYAQTSNQNQVVQDLVRSIATHIDVESTRVNTSTKPSEAGVGIEIIADDPSYTHDVKIETSVNGLKVSYRNNKPIELTAPVRDLWSITVIPGTNRILPTYGCSTQSPDFNNSQGVYYWEDKDGDGYFVDNIILVCGAPPSGFIKEEDLKGVDCDDTVYHTEQPDPYYYFDEDGDGYPGSWGTFCERPPGGKQYNELKSGVLDCNDNDPTVWQRTTSFIDIDGDGYTNGTVFLCSQGELPEGFTNQSYGEDCDDENPNIFRELELYIDNDGDGYTDGRITMCIGTSIPMGYQLTSLGIDCDDEDPNITRLCCIPIQDLQVREPLFVEGCSIEDLAPSTGFSLSIETQTSISIDSFLQHLELFDRTICGLKSVAYQDWLISNNAGRIRVDRTFYLEEESYLSNYTEEIYIEDNTAPIPNQEELPELFLDCADQFIQPPTANDACDGEITGTRNTEIEYDDPNDFTITWTFMDLFGNQSTQQQHVKVTNTDPPVPYVPTLPEIIAECSFQITEVPKAIDSCGGEINATTDNDQEYFEEGTYTITWTFTDGNGLQTTQEQNVTLIKLDPIPSLPELEVIVTQCSVTDIQAPTATGGCNGEIITGIRDESIIYSEQGEYIIIWTFDDGNGNMTTQEQMVVVEDTEAPIA